MRGTAPNTLTLPPFRGATRQIVLVNVVIFFALAVLSFAAPAFIGRVELALALSPERVAHGWLWQPLTYAFLNIGILGTAFGLLTLWFTGSMLEDARGSRWFTELFYVSAVGGGLLAALLGMLPLLFGPHVRLFTLMPYELTFGIFAPLFGILVAFGILFADVEIMLLFVLRMRVKYLVAIYILIDLARLILDKQPLTATVELCCGLSAFLYVRYAASRGMGNMFTERYFGMRNDFYRYKRRRAAKKFAVYMRKQGKTDIHFDNEGRYISPEDERRNPNDRKWMN